MLLFTIIMQLYVCVIWLIMNYHMMMTGTSPPVYMLIIMPVPAALLGMYT